MSQLAPLTKYRCAICNVRLREGRYVYSRFTKNRYCLDSKKHVEVNRRKRKAAA